ncbi:hypothetical protein LTR53_012941 [Teratosphaeriaceae sp. CCFEE 6253]|nr:hypothetical protein LTR53_012941 [Teratosphaeriaceae sp. CCFEE 6253]
MRLHAPSLLDSNDDHVAMLATLGLTRSSISTREIELLRQAPIEQRDLIRQAPIEQRESVAKRVIMEQLYSYGVLDQAQEDALHATRLLAVEERPFARVQRSLLSKDSLLRAPPRQLPSPPPEGTDGSPQIAVDRTADFIRFRTDILLDFAALDSSLLRIQLLHASNRLERARYAAEKAKILQTAQAVRENTVQLRLQLEEAQRVLELRKGYDAVAAKILDDRGLNSREESGREVLGLGREIAELEQESGEYQGLWAGRREQFERVVAEGEAMRRLIKRVREEAETGEEGESQGVDGAEEETGIESSRLGTPVLGERTPMRVDGGETPLPGSGEAGDGTPARPANRFLEVEDATRASSRAASPSLHPSDPSADTEMTEAEAEALETVDAQAPAETSTGMDAGVERVMAAAEGVAVSGQVEPEGMDET